MSNTPNTRHGLYTAMSSRWALCRDFADGTHDVRAKGETYLPRHAAESEDDHKLRLEYAVVYNAYDRALDAMSGLAFSHDPVLGDDVAPPIQLDWENLNLAGTHGDVLLRELFREGLTMGHVGILVDHNQTAAPVPRVTRRQKGFRPYWVPYTAEQIINWRTGFRNGRVCFTLLVLEERVEMPVGRFGSTSVLQYRVFLHPEGQLLPSFELWAPSAPNAAVQMVHAGTLTTSRIPFALARLGKIRSGTPVFTRPPLYDLAELNLAHYRILADRRNIMHLACVPILVEIGGSPPKPGQAAQQVGPGTYVRIPNTDGDLKYVEPAGTALTPTREELQDTERRMAQLSLAFLASETRQAETAEGKRIDAAAQNATLSTSIRAMEDAVEEALGFHAEYYQQPGGSITLNREFTNVNITPELIKVLSDLVAVQQLDLDTFWELLKSGRILPAGFDGDRVKARLSLDGLGPTEAELDQPVTEENAA